MIILFNQIKYISFYVSGVQTNLEVCNRNGNSKFQFFFQSKKEFKYTISNKTAIKPSIVEYEASGVHFLQEPCKLVLVPLNMAPSLRHGYLYQSEGIVRFEAPKESTGVHHIWT